VVDNQGMLRHMKKSRMVRAGAGILLAFLLSGCGAPVWLLDPPSAERIAKEKNRPLLLYFKAWDSTQHRNMALEVLNNPAVKPELMDTVNVELEFAFFPEYRKRYSVQQPQVCVMCSPDGKKVYTPLYVNPVPTVDKFLEWLRRAKAEAMPTLPTTTKAK
jgi:hypothetical protein